MTRYKKDHLGRYVKRNGRYVKDRLIDVNESGRVKLVVGIGTGRCGTLSLSKILSRHSGVSVMHEPSPLLDWRHVSSLVVERFVRHCVRHQGSYLVGEVSHFLGPGVERLVDHFPFARVVWLERDKEEVVESFLRWVEMKGQKLGMVVDHWTRGCPWNDKYDWCFPKFDVDDIGEAIGLFWDEYQRLGNRLRRKNPSNVLKVKTEHLSDPPEIERILRHVGVQGDLNVEPVVANSYSDCCR